MPATLPAREAVTACLAQAFTEQISDVAPVPVQVYLGSRGDPAFTLSTGPLLAAAVGVALVVILGTVLLSDRVLRPIGRLTTAVHRLGRGDLAGRVPVSGNDELAELGRSFNRMADSLRRGEERQRRLVADVAHELRTPLANLRGYLEALADGVIEPGPELFASLHEEAVLQQRIVDDLQDLALAEAGTLAYHRGPVDVAELLETCRTAHHAQAVPAGVALTVHTDGSPLPVHADPDRLRQALGNLITNALRATAPGGTVRLHADRTDATVRIHVADTGIGIPADRQEAIFDPFVQVDSSHTRGAEGSGLGLAICRRLLAAMDAELRCESAPGEGARFYFELTMPPA